MVSRARLVRALDARPSADLARVLALVLGPVSGGILTILVSGVDRARRRRPNIRLFFFDVSARMRRC